MIFEMQCKREPGMHQKAPTRKVVVKTEVIFERLGRALFNSKQQILKMSE